jgi:hypothetical protein
LTAADLQKLLAGEQFLITLTRDDQPITEGTPYSKGSVLPDELAAVICPDVTDPTPADAFNGVYEMSTTAQNIAKSAMPKSNFLFDPSTGTLAITL